jgi:hypothetical protein
MLSETVNQHNSGIQVQDTWEVWNVTKSGDEFLVLDGLSEKEAEEIAEQFTQDPSKKYFDEEKGIEVNAEFAARNGGVPQTAVAGPSMNQEHTNELNLQH